MGSNFFRVYISSIIYMISCCYCFSVSILNFKTCQIWGKRSCLPAGEGGLCKAWKARGVSAKEGWGRQPGAWLWAGTKQGTQALSPGGGVAQRERERGFFVSKMAYFLARQPWPVMPCRLSGQQPASQTQARWVSRLCVDRLPVVDWMKKPVNFEFLEKCQGDCVEISTVFINPDIYLGRETTIP